LQYVEEFDENSMICAGNLESGGIDFCNGDAGQTYMKYCIYTAFNGVLIYKAIARIKCELHLIGQVGH
jgi:hypothetical protein